MEKRIFPIGTPVNCNRCRAMDELLEETEGVLAQGSTFRLTQMRRLQCGHLDCHWVYDPPVMTRDGRCVVKERKYGRLVE